MQRHRSDATRAANLPFSDAVQVGDTLYVSGHLGHLPGVMQVVPGGIAAESRQTLDNLKATLERCGSSLADVVKVTVFLADMAEWPAFNAVYTSYFGGRAINAGIGDKRLTSLLTQLNVRKAMTPRTEVYASVVRVQALGSIKDAGGKDIFYSRVQLTARF